jgi:hypothetical protein
VNIHAALRLGIASGVHAELASVQVNDQNRMAADRLQLLECAVFGCHKFMMRSLILDVKNFLDANLEFLYLMIVATKQKPEKTKQKATSGVRVALTRDEFKAVKRRAGEASMTASGYFRWAVNLPALKRGGAMPGAGRPRKAV